MQDSASTTRTFNARYTLTLDGAVMSHSQHILTVTGPTSRPELLTFTLDGQPCTFEEAERITRLALSLGRFEKVSESAPSIGKKRAAAMHREMAKHGYPTNHYDLASGILGREVASLAALTEAEARTVWTSLIYGAGIAA